MRGGSREGKGVCGSCCVCLRFMCGYGDDGYGGETRLNRGLKSLVWVVMEQVWLNGERVKLSKGFQAYVELYLPKGGDKEAPRVYHKLNDR